VIRMGMAQAPTAPGLGTALLPEVARRPDVRIREQRRS
jgi:galactonate dehydratase